MRESITSNLLGVAKSSSYGKQSNKKCYPIAGMTSYLSQWQEGVFVMGKIRTRKETGRLYLDFFYKGIRCREQTALNDTPTNRKTVEKLLQRIEARILLDDFDYAEFFPESKNIKKIQKKRALLGNDSTELYSDCDALPEVNFEEFANQWFIELQVEWRLSHRRSVSSILEKSLIPEFGAKLVNNITKANILEFRGNLAKRKGRGDNKTLSPKTINSHIESPPVF